MTNAKESYRNRNILTQKEIGAMLKKAEAYKDDYVRLRAKCLIALLKKFGKSRSEIVTQ